MDKNFFEKKIENIKQNYNANEKCPVIHAIKMIGSKWKIPILWNITLEDGIHYNQLKRKVTGITNTMLTKSLKELEKDGLIKRVSYGTIPPSVSYHLTDIGRELILTFVELRKWGILHIKNTMI
ncbi:MAG: helix-turn-helix domain-containing protein [Fusobacterium sp.]|uniref:winged helix-turn-helix transcriptional regulator n=1 Tax=Fusobacterium sp. TaxID=68766 RepID=UPI0026DC788E|nr:helix-turn-helix domain-containing protein [Fusobacterium sp.]MDO4691228.1 helix-turn-helix domain-containing protein [Fusobacterium sp.]